MARPKDPDLERVWRQRLQRQTSSGLTIPEFCARQGLSCSSFYAWKRRLTARSLPSRPAPPLFVPLHLDPRPLDGDQAPGPAVVIESPPLVRLRSDAPPEPEWLGRVVAALARLPRPEATP
jgi:hypothetical protein